MNAIQSIDIERLSFRFPGRKALLKEVSISAKRGEIISIFGKSGSGKTTLLRILQRFYTPETGEIVVNNNEKWENLSTIGWRKLITTVPQEIKLFNGTLLENIGLGPVSEEEINKIIAFCNIYEFSRYFASFPQGYGTLLGENGVAISGGQRQLVGLARALYQNPQLLLLDEPTASMDRKMEAEILRLITRLKKDMLIILVTHRIENSSLADQIYSLENGTLTAYGSPEELKSKSISI